MAGEIIACKKWTLLQESCCLLSVSNHESKKFFKKRNFDCCGVYCYHEDKGDFNPHHVLSDHFNPNHDLSLTLTK